MTPEPFVFTDFPSIPAIQVSLEYLCKANASEKFSHGFPGFWV